MKSPILEEITILKDICSTAKENKDVSSKMDCYYSYTKILTEVYTCYVDLINEYNVLKDVNKFIKDEVKECFNQYKNSFMSLLESLNNDNANNQAFLALKSLNNNFERILNLAWGTYIANKIGGTYKTLNLFRDFIAREEYNDISRNYSNILSSSPNKKTLQDIVEFLAVGDRIIASMNADEDIIKFIVKVSSGVATLNDVSDKVLKWFKEHNYTNKIKITM